MSDSKATPTDPWITSLQSLQPASAAGSEANHAGLDTRTVFYQMGFRAAQQQAAEANGASRSTEAAKRIGWRFVAAACVLVMSAGSVGYLAGRSSVPNAMPGTDLAGAPHTAEIQESLVVLPSAKRSSVDVAQSESAPAMTKRIGKQSQTSWLTSWFSRSLAFPTATENSQGLMAISHQLRGDDLFLNDQWNSFGGPIPFQKPDDSMQATKWVSTRQPAKTLTAADLHELSQEWDKIK